MSVTNGQAANQTTFNNAYVSKTATSSNSATGIIGLNNTSDVNSGDEIVNTQRYINEIAEAAGVAGEGDTGASDYSSSNVVSDGDDRKVAIGKLDAKFHATTGHSHDGTSGNGAPIDASDVANLNNYRAAWQTFTVTGAAGIDDTITTQMSGKTAGGGTSSAGVITSAPYNKVEIRVSATETFLEDAGGQRVYGRITESGGTWTLTYYTNEAGSETSTSVSSTNIRVYYREVFTLGTIPTIPDDAGFIGSLDLTADVVDAGSGQRGVVSTGAQTLDGKKTFAGGVKIQSALETPKTDVASTATINQLTYSPFVKLTGSTATTLNGIGSGVDGAKITIYNGSSQTMTITHESGSATAADRFALFNSANLSLSPGQSDGFIYDSGQSRWVPESTTQSGSTIPSAPMDAENYGFTFSVAANALTINLKNNAGNDPSGSDPVKVSFGSATVTSATYTTVLATAATSLTISSGATIGHQDGVEEVGYIYGINNAGALELSVVGSMRSFDDGNVVNTTVMNSSADNRATMYSTTARSGVPARLMAIFYITQTTAGTWVNNVTRVINRPHHVPQQGCYTNNNLPVRILSAYITNNGTAAISRQDGSWVSSVSRTAAGTVEVNIATGSFSSTANYMVTISNGNTNKSSVISSHSATQVVVQCNTNTTGAGSDQDFFIYGIGPA